MDCASAMHHDRAEIARTPHVGGLAAANFRRLPVACAAARPPCAIESTQALIEWAHAR